MTSGRIRRRRLRTGKMPLTMSETITMRLIVGVLLLAISLPSFAEWVKLAENVEMTFRIDLATILIDGNFRQVSELHDLKQRGKQGEMSRRVLMEYDCKGEQHRLLSLTTHSEPMAEGNVLISVSRASDWHTIVTGTSAAAILKRVCSK